MKEINNVNNNDKLSLWFYIKSGLTFRYISNISIIVCILAYYMNAYDVFFIFAPLIVVNLIIIILIQLCDKDKLLSAILGKTIPNEVERNKVIPTFLLLLNIWHILPIFWLIYILEKDNLIKLFHPSFISIFCKSIIIPIIYYYYEFDLKLYGDINYVFYFIIYVLLLLATCFYLYNDNSKKF